MKDVVHRYAWVVDGHSPNPLPVVYTRQVADETSPKDLSNARELQVDLHAWMQEYNERRPHQYRKTPRQTFIDSVSLAKEKILAA